MNCVFEFLQKRGYDLDNSYYSYIENWINIWQGKAEWLDVRTIEGKKYPMYSLNIAKRSCEDLASVVTSEPFTIKATKNDEILQNNLKQAKVLEKLPEMIEIMGYTGTVGTVTRIINAEVVGEDETATLRRTNKTKIKTIILKANQIIPLTYEDGEMVNCAFVSKVKKKIAGKNKKLYYMELHELEERGYQVTNKYFDVESGQEVVIDGIIETYNTLSHVPLFNIRKLDKVNPIDNNNNLGIALFGNALDQLQILDTVYNNFGMDFKLGQKVLLVNKKLTKIETEEYTDKDGQIKQRQKVIYPTDIQKQLFTDISDGLMGTPDKNPYVYEYNPDLRVGDNKEGVQFALDTYCFEIGFGTHFYSFENGSLQTATEAMLSRKDFVDNMNKVRKGINEFLKGICKSILLCEKMLGNAGIDEKQEIEIAEVDNFLASDEDTRQRLLTDFSAGLISKRKYLKTVYKMSDEEIDEEIKNIENEEKINSISME